MKTRIQHVKNSGRRTPQVGGGKVVCGGGAGGVTKPKQKKQDAGVGRARRGPTGAVVYNRYVKKTTAVHNVMWIRFNRKDLFDTLRSLPHDLIYTLENGLWLQDRLRLGLQRRGIQYLNDVLKENHWALTDLQHFILYEVVAPTGSFVNYDILLECIDRREIELGRELPLELRSNLTAYPTLAKEEAVEPGRQFLGKDEPKTVAKVEQADPKDVDYFLARKEKFKGAIERVAAAYPSVKVENLKNTAGFMPQTIERLEKEHPVAGADHSSHTADSWHDKICLTDVESKMNFASCIQCPRVWLLEKDDVRKN